MTTTTRTFEARITEVSDVTDVFTKQVTAAYFAEEDGFVVFKDSEHAKVFAVRSDCLISVERVEATKG
jgi:hypothetical protein